MAQAYEYEVVETAAVNPTAFNDALAAADADKWEVIGYAIYIVSAGTPTRSALLRRRL